jgi:hypothetical protein
MKKCIGNQKFPEYLSKNNPFLQHTQSGWQNEKIVNYE